MRALYEHRMHENLCTEYGKPHTGWSSYKRCTSVACMRIYAANTESPTLDIYEHHLYVDYTADIKHGNERRGLREHDRLRRQMEATEEREARFILITLSIIACSLPINGLASL